MYNFIHYSNYYDYYAYFTLNQTVTRVCVCVCIYIYIYIHICIPCCYNYYRPYYDNAYDLIY